MHDIFKATGIAARNYDWYISAIETTITPPGFSSADQWMRGEGLASLILKHDIRCIGAVFSAILPDFVDQYRRCHTWTAP